MVDYGLSTKITARIMETCEHAGHGELSDFQENVCKHASYYMSVAEELYLTDFNPLTVDWTTPVGWGNDPDKCSMTEDSGCLMPNWAGLCAPTSFAPQASHKNKLPNPILTTPNPILTHAESYPNPSPSLVHSLIILGFGVFFSVVTTILTMVRSIVRALHFPGTLG